MPFYIGLSVLSNKSLQRREGLRVLAMLDGRGALPEPELGENSLGIQREPGGRPFFEDRHAEFNISHSGWLCAAAYSASRSLEASLPPRIGCDVQILSKRKNYQAIAESFYFSGERQYILDAPDQQEAYRRFISLWVLKESYLKLRGLSILNIKETPEFFIYPQQSAGSERQIPIIFQENEEKLSIYLWELQLLEGDFYYLACIKEILEKIEDKEPEFIFLPEELSQKTSLRRIAPVDYQKNVHFE